MFKFRSYDDQKNFEKWAFGSTPIKYDVKAMHTWNSHHGDIYFLDEAEIIEISLKKMYELYENHVSGDGSK